jgi:hypothetical protein
MKLMKFSMRAGTLKSVSPDELFFNVQMGILLNEVIILNKLAHFSLPSETEDNQVLKEAQFSQFNFLTKLLAGKLLAGEELIEKHYFGTSLANRYDDLLLTEGKECLEKLKGYFGKSNHIRRIRNRFAVHHASNELKIDVLKLVDMLEPSDPLTLYFAPEEGNCLYSFYHSMVNYLMFVRADGTGVSKLSNEELATAIKALHAEVQFVTKWFIGFAQDVVRIFSETYFKTLESQGEEVEIPAPPKFSEVRAPYFVTQVSNP